MLKKGLFCALLCLSTVAAAAEEDVNSKVAKCLTPGASEDRATCVQSAISSESERIRKKSMDDYDTFVQQRIAKYGGSPSSGGGGGGAPGTGAPMPSIGPTPPASNVTGTGAQPPTPPAPPPAPPAENAPSSAPVAKVPTETGPPVAPATNFK